MNISLTQELEQFVAAKLGSGMYHSASEVIREGLRLLKERDELHNSKLSQLKQEINLGYEQLERGEGVSGEDVYTELKQMSKARHQQKS